VLTIFNLVPIPPLDGSKILFAFLPASASRLVAFLEQYSLILLLVFVAFFADLLYPILAFMYHLLTGLVF
jgi:Zn-dependent protease